MSGLYRFDCVFYYVSEMDRAIAFYQGVLGFKVLSRDVVARFEVDGTLFELVPATDHGKLSGSGNARLALRVENLNEVLEELRARGVPVTAAENKGTGLLAFLRDPDGNEICLWQYFSM